MMIDAQIKTHDSYVSSTLEILEGVLADYPNPNFAVRFWDGSRWQSTDEGCLFTLVLNQPSSLRRMFFPPSERSLGEAYMFGDFDIEGDMVAAMNLAKYLWESWHWTDMLRYAPALLRLPMSNHSSTNHQALISGQPHSVERDKAAIQHHYDISNEFYQLWLDRQMVYSCAYFASPSDDIDTAQQRKLDYICRKLRLKAGERLLDIGCGWGALVRHAAKHYGVNAIGISLSEKQVAYANLKILQEGLEQNCQVVLQDYREVSETEPFDKIVSVGMVEHVGRENLPSYFEKAYRLLRPGGVFLNHGISSQADYFSSLQRGRNSFIQQYIFPDGDIQPIDYLLSSAMAAGFEIRDLENLREHYALTLKHWFNRYEINKTTIQAMLGNEAYRQWRIYLAASRWLFEYGLHGLHQALFYKIDKVHPMEDRFPLTRADWFLY